MDDHVINELSAYVDGELPDPGRVQRHLQVCPACAARHLEMLRLSAQLRALQGPEVSPAFTANVFARLDAQPVFHRRPAFLLAWGMAAMLLLAVGLWLLPGQPKKPDFAAQLAAEVERMVAQDAAFTEDELGADDVAEHAGNDLTTDDVLHCLARAAADETASDAAADLPDEETGLLDSTESLDPEEVKILVQMLEEYRSEG